MIWLDSMKVQSEIKPVLFLKPLLIAVVVGNWQKSVG